ncbi:MAG TPA: DEAD/DEAH box helicase, partial [Actinomycetota bacterium]
MAPQEFSPAVREWFRTAFEAPTAAQEQGWPAISSGDHTLILAPTGSGKTLAAFLWGLDRLASEPMPEDPKRRTRLLYISPLRALAVDVEKNLRAPLAGISLAAERLGKTVHAPTVGMRTGDTPANERRQLLKEPPDILITTPESLYLMLTSSARETLRSVRWVIVDEIHSVAATKRGSHLALSLERLEEITDRPPQRIGLSATQRPLEEIARFLGGSIEEGPRPVTVVDAGSRKPMEIEVVVPIEDMGAIGDVQEEEWQSGPAAVAPTRLSIWPSIDPVLLDLIREHRTTLIFANARRLAERLAARLNELAGEELVRAHHGSLSREQRLSIEDQLKSGTLKGLVATSSLELGIDMGAIDLVVQVESPGSVARGLQRIGRAGHRVGEPSRGKLFPKYRGDLLEAAIVVRRMQDGLIEETRYPRNPLDVLAQQIVAMTAVDEWNVTDLLRVIRRAAPYADLSEEIYTAVLDLLSGRYPSDEFAGLRPRVVWDRKKNIVRAREGAGRLAITSGGTIPDRGLFGVFTPEGTRVGELDEEMVYESRAGEVFLLGASAWRIEDITIDRVIVSPAPGEPGKMPFWHGDKPGRPLELGRALGAFSREIREAKRDDALQRLRADHGLDELAAENLLMYLDEQFAATGAIPDDRTIVIERFPDEIGDWRVCLLTPFGARVHAPWAMAIEARLAERDIEVQLLWSDDGIVIRLPEAEESIPTEELLLDPDDVEELVVSRLPNTALFASLFRESAARALLLPRRMPGRRTPLWQQRQRAADLLNVAGKHPTFPILLETTREAIKDVFDVPALKQVLTDLRARRIRAVAAETTKASPFAQSLLFQWIGTYMYEGDAPPAERRAAALALDRDLLRELLGAEELRELIDPAALDSLELELQGL